MTFCFDAGRRIAPEIEVGDHSKSQQAQPDTVFGVHAASIDAKHALCGRTHIGTGLLIDFEEALLDAWCCVDGEDPTARLS